ncbi:hypothetical protein J2752_001968 [Halarchaeum rubridurum]|uniref:Envelope protein N-terminal domain-containing protein n=1 Tax=Halarchaeum rubridurum TaxID=489911 RepID=A0A830G0L9_9EURY|nr:hypothetical protein [Halarchaeum rubridurum]MBP1955056.1 hypothetical protein [Halarchaeum rubridurum]GGM69283.1 hypothetical protein GCM10009017_19370 [Halarchaeum rubridurum]
MTSTIGRVGRVLLAVALVSSMVAAPVAGATGDPGGQPALGVSDSTTCSALGSAAAFATLGMAGPAVQSTCTSWTTAQQVEDTANADANVTKADLEIAAQAQRTQFETTQTVFNNYLNDSRSAAWMAAETAVANYWANTAAANRSKVEARAAARQAIKDYWSVKQANLIQSWNTQIDTWQTLDARAAEEKISGSFVSPTLEKLRTNDPTYFEPANLEIKDVNVTLANGTKISVQQAIAKHQFIGPDTNTLDVYRYTPMGTSGTRQILLHNLTVGDTALLPTQWYVSTGERIQTISSNQISTSYNWIDGMWGALQNDSISPSAITSRTTDLYRMSPDAGENASLYRATAALSGLGLSTPTLDGLGTMEVTHGANNTTDYGLILANQAPNGSWQAHTTYNASAIPGAEYLATTDGEQIPLTGTFTVGNITTTNGGQIDSVDAQRVVYRTSNATQYVEKMEALLNQTQAAQRGGGGGPTGGTGGGGSSPVIVAGLGVAALLAVVYLQNRSN